MDQAVGYIRLSTEDQSQYSIEFQETGIRDYCTRNKLTLSNIFIDNGESSYTFDRKGFKDLETEMRARKQKYLIVYHLDRFGRNMAEAMLKVRSYKERGILVRDISEPIDLDDDDPNTFLLRSLKFMSAESELHRIRQRTKSGMRQAALNGRYTGPAPYGYINSRDEDGRKILTIDDEKATHVRIAFREYLNGMSIVKIRAIIGQYGKLPQGSSAVQKLLGNPVYAGLIRVPAAKNIPAKLVTGLHTPIISEQDYWLAQQRLHGKTITLQNRDEVPLRGVLQCWCGKKVTAGNSRSKSGRYYWYYLCPEHRKNMPATRLHTQFSEILDHLSFDLETLRIFKEKLTTRVTDYLNNREANMSIIRKQLTTIENKIQATEEKYLRKADVSEITYNRVIGEYKAERSRLYIQLAGSNTNEQAYWQVINEVLLRLSNVCKSFEEMSVDKKQEFIAMVFDCSLWYENDCYRTPSIHYLFEHNLQILNEKGLLKISSPVLKIGQKSLGTPEGSPVEHKPTILDDLDRLYKIFVA